jgi:hypothetical protein
MNQPGPLKLEDPAFRRQIERAFRLVAGIESADERPAKRGARKRAESRS